MAQAQLLDARVNAFDHSLNMAEVALEDQLGSGWIFITPKQAIATDRVSLRSSLDEYSTQVTEALPGEYLEFLWEINGTCYVRTKHDGYLGWIPLKDCHFTDQETGCKITALRAHAFQEPKVSSKIEAELCLGSMVWISTSEEHVDQYGILWKHVQLANGKEAWIHSQCIQPRTEKAPAELILRFLDTPYVWGGRSTWGIDCSGLVQFVHQYFGQFLPRDSDQQQASLTEVTEPQYGDLAFFPGHVGMMLDQHRMIHANSRYMRVTIDTLGEGEYGQMLEKTCTGFGRYDLPK